MSQKRVLAASSGFRKQLLEKLNLPFVTASPDADETAQENETPEQLVQRLSIAKAEAIVPDFPNHLIIGSDQVACIDGEILGKPGSFDNALAQLRNASGKTVTFYTGLTLINSSTGNRQTACETFNVHFRNLNDAQITRYLQLEQPYNCAGSFKSEGLGISLFEKLEGDDPNSLIGLPLIRLIQMLDREGIAVP